MPVKVKLGRNPATTTVGRRLLQIVLIATAAACVLFLLIFGYFWLKYRSLVDDRLKQGPLFASLSQVYAAPQEVRPGQQRTVQAIAATLRRSGYNGDAAHGNPMGSFDLRGDSILIKPGPQSYLATDGATINAAGGIVQSITAENGAPLAAYKLEPQLITALSEDKNRTKRRLVTYSQIPKQMVDAVTAIEDRRFFEHGGINYITMVGWIWHDIKGDRRVRGGGSTLTMQLAKLLFVEPNRTSKIEFIGYKFRQIVVAYILESRFTKPQIFEIYSNEINLGQRGSFAINGFGEAAQAYFGKDLKQLDIAECALLAGMIQRPNYFSPFRHAERAMERRNLVLDSMVETGSLTQDQADRAKAEPIRLAPPNVDASEAPYFVDLVHDQIVQRMGDSDQSRATMRIYTSLDPELQRIASDAVQDGMKNVDELVRKLHRHATGPITYPQVALVALNPRTGQVLALVGGRDYGASQLNHAVAERPTGSIFKPFVYATAYNTSLDGTAVDGNGVFTALTRLNDDPQDFAQPGQPPYIPGNFDKGEYPGMVTAADALAHSLNIATIALAQKVGYGNVATLAHEAGIVSARATPSMAIGTYSATPIDMAGAYTTFANAGVRIKPWLLSSVRNETGDIVADFTPEAHQVLDPRVAFLTQTLMEGVLQRGTGIKVRSLGFTAPAAGKTGTSHDAWFAGYTTSLLAVIWIGNDDYTDVKLQGADAAAPIWAGFMNRAIKLPQYSDNKSFVAPEGVETLRIDRATNLVADETCPSDSFVAAFLIGTAPQASCSRMGIDAQTLGNQLYNPSQPDDPNKPHRNFFQKLFGLGGNKDTPPPPQDTPHDNPQP